MGREELLRLGGRLKLDAAAAEVVRGLEKKGISAVLLKGSALAERLYDASEVRPQDDIDLLVSPADLARAGQVLRESGFAYAADDEYAQDWIRAADGVTVDIHTTFLGIRAGPEATWEAFSVHTRATTVGGVEMPVFDDAALALHVALHAAQHGPKGDKALEDLRRAVLRLDFEHWQEAARLAETLAALPALGAGLRLVPKGAAIAGRLGLAAESPADVTLRASSPPPTTLGVQRLFATPGAGRKLRFLVREVAPPVPFMRAVYPVARRGPGGLVAAYAWRQLWLVWHAIPALRAWRRAERTSRGATPPET
jgi:hypothetical protein